MKRKYFYLLSLIMFALFCNSFKTSGTEFFVSKKGKDSNTGSAKSPFLTISAASRAAKPGDFTPEQQAGVVMENYDFEFVKVAKKGDIVAGGFNFGTGSSREQAATAFKYKGIACVIAGSFSETYARNAINNGFLIIECSDLVNDLKEKYGKEKLTVQTNKKVKIDFENSSISFNGKEYSIDPIGEAAQELIITGGLEEWVKKNL